MNNISRNVFLVLLFLVGFTIIMGIGGVPLTDPDEPVYAETAREMIAFKDYLSPRIFNEFWYDKPPLYYWLVAGAFQLFGISEFTSRLPAAIMAILTVVSVYVSATKLFNERVGFWSGMVLGTSVMMFYMGKAAVTDTTLLFFLTGALLCFLHKRYWLMYVCCGFATLTKGPIGFVFPGTIIFLYLLFTRDLKRMLSMHVLPGLCLSLLICGPWYYLMYQAHGMEFINTFLGFHNITRFSSPEHPGRVLWYYYIPVIILGMFPWTGILFKSMKDTISESRSSDLRLMIFMHVWWIFVFIFFTIAKTKLISYILPLFPALAIMVGWNIDRMLKENKGHYTAWALGSGLMFLLMAVGWIVGGQQMPELAFGGIVLGTITLLLGIGIVVALKVYRDGILGVWLHVATGILTMVVAFSFLIPVVQDKFSVKTITGIYSQVATQEGRSLYVDKFLRPGFMFYTHTPGKEVVGNRPESITAVKEDKGSKYAVMRIALYKRYAQRMGAEDWRLLAEKDGIGIYGYEAPKPAPVVAPKAVEAKGGPVAKAVEKTAAKAPVAPAKEEAAKQ